MQHRIHLYRAVPARGQLDAGRQRRPGAPNGLASETERMNAAPGGDVRARRRTPDPEAGQRHEVTRRHVIELIRPLSP
jgi:hypothetical protein